MHWFHYQTLNNRDQATCYLLTVVEAFLNLLTHADTEDNGVIKSLELSQHDS